MNARLTALALAVVVATAPGCPRLTVDSRAIRSTAPVLVVACAWIRLLGAWE